MVRRRQLLVRVGGNEPSLLHHFARCGRCAAPTQLWGRSGDLVSEDASSPAPSACRLALDPSAQGQLSSPIHQDSDCRSVAVDFHELPIRKPCRTVPGADDGRYAIFTCDYRAVGLTDNQDQSPRRTAGCVSDGHSRLNRLCGIQHYSIAPGSLATRRSTSTLPRSSTAVAQ
jgi:hypothetical protein